MIFETHAHYDDEAFDEDRASLLCSMQENGIGRIINVSASLESLARTSELMESYPFLYGAFGLHPDEVGDLNEAVMEQLYMRCQKEKAVAVGEIGLDYYWDKESHDQQIYWFRRQLNLAREVHLPVIIHSRDAAADTLRVMREEKSEEIGGVIHCFSYSREMAEQYLAMGFYLGIGGVVTFKNARKIREVVEAAPLDRLLLETDSPYLAPVPYRGKRNCSLYLPYVVEKIAEIKGICEEEVIAVTEKNAERLFLKEVK
ncbi:MAG: TatD family hydrolase [Fusicatenibacter sp.]|nr:TatD family hydrolase [Fusicatenibacter sp.]